MRIAVDHEALADGLEEGMGHINAICADLPAESRLRIGFCGLVSTAISLSARKEGLPVTLAVSTPSLACDPEMSHVFPLVGDPKDPVVIDASYSQFLAYAGMHPYYEKLTRTHVLPDKKVLDFRFHERHVAIAWLTDTILNFQRTREYPSDDNGVVFGLRSLAQADPVTVQQTLSRIWSPQFLEPFTPSRRVVEDAYTVAHYIPRGTISVG